MTDSKTEADWVCQVCGQPTNAYNCVRANLHRACESLPVASFNQAGMFEFCDLENASKQARLFGGAR